MFKELIIKLFIFFIYPFGGFMYSLTNLKRRSTRYVLFLFFVLFGFTFTPKDKGLDGYSYMESFSTYTTHASRNLTEDIKSYFAFESEKSKDIYLTTSFNIVSRFTNNYHFLFALYAIIFGFFYIKTFKFLVINKNFQNTLPFYVLFFLFVLSNPIFNINGVRFWTASWIAVYAMFQIFIQNEKKYLLLAILTPLVHGSFFIYLFLLSLIFLTRKSEKFWIPVFVISLFVSGVSFLNLAEQITDFLPPFLQRFVYVYTQSEYALKRIAGIEKNIIVQVLEFLPRVFIAVNILLFIINKDKIKQDPVSKVVFEMILVWYSFCFFALNIPSVGERFFAVGIPLIVYLWINSYPVMKQYNRWFINGMPVAYSYVIWGYFIRLTMVSEPVLYVSTLIHIIVRDLQ